MTPQTPAGHSPPIVIRHLHRQAAQSTKRVGASRVGRTVGASRNRFRPASPTQKVNQHCASEYVHARPTGRKDGRKDAHPPMGGSHTPNRANNGP
eukprot:4184394-Prymnesium_polylepis.1